MPVLVITENFKGQITSSVTELLESNNIQVCLLPLNTTYRPASAHGPLREQASKRSFEEEFLKIGIRVTTQLDEKRWSLQTSSPSIWVYQCQRSWGLSGWYRWPSIWRRPTDYRKWVCQGRDISSSWWSRGSTGRTACMKWMMIQKMTLKLHLVVMMTILINMCRKMHVLNFNKNL